MTNMLKHTRSRALSSLLTLILFLALASTGWAATPKSVIKSSHEKINRLLKKEKSGKVAKGALEGEMKKVINRFLDFDALARASMSKHWKTLNAAQQKQFITLFRQLIESNYIKRLRGDLSYKVVYGKTTTSGGKAKVPTTVERMKRGRKSETKIVYRLKKTSGRWQVHDVVTNNVSLARNYRRSFGRVMRRNGFDSLLKKMKRKIKSLR